MNNWVLIDNHLIHLDHVTTICKVDEDLCIVNFVGGESFLIEKSMDYITDLLYRVINGDNYG